MSLRCMAKSKWISQPWVARSINRDGRTLPRIAGARRAVHCNRPRPRQVGEHRAPPPRQKGEGGGKTVTSISGNHAAPRLNERPGQAS